MPVKTIELGPTGMTVADNIRRFREARRLGYAELSRGLSDLGREIPPLGLRRIEAGVRRVDTDDLVTIALALNVSPLALLLPAADGPIAPKDGRILCDQIWRWGRGLEALPDSPDPVQFVRDSNPMVTELGSQLAEVATSLAGHGQLGARTTPASFKAD